MKKFLFLILISCFACQENKKENIFDANATTESKTPETVKICFLSTGSEIQRGNKILQDSTILNLEIKGNKVTGNYQWLPAGKDSRKGTLKATTKENVISGTYTFNQEGTQETQPILIQLKENAATIITNKNLQGEMTLK